MEAGTDLLSFWVLHDRQMSHVPYQEAALGLGIVRTILKQCCHKHMASTCIRLARFRSPLALYYSHLTHPTKKPGWSHAWVLHGPEGCAVVSLNKHMASTAAVDLHSSAAAEIPLLLLATPVAAGVPLAH